MTKSFDTEVEVKTSSSISQKIAVGVIMLGALSAAMGIVMGLPVFKEKRVTSAEAFKPIQLMDGAPSTTGEKDSRYAQYQFLRDGVVMATYNYSNNSVFQQNNGNINTNTNSNNTKKIPTSSFLFIPEASAQVTSYSIEDINGSFDQGDTISEKSKSPLQVKITQSEINSAEIPAIAFSLVTDMGPKTLCLPAKTINQNSIVSYYFDIDGTPYFDSKLKNKVMNGTCRVNSIAYNPTTISGINFNASYPESVPDGFGIYFTRYDQNFYAMTNNTFAKMTSDDEIDFVEGGKAPLVLSSGYFDSGQEESTVPARIYTVDSNLGTQTLCMPEQIITGQWNENDQKYLGKGTSYYYDTNGTPYTDALLTNMATSKPCNELLAEKIQNTIKQTYFDINDSDVSMLTSDGVKNDLIFSSKPSNKVPLIDGNLESSEIDDAFSYNIDGTNDAKFEAYTKLITYNDEIQLYLGIKIKHNNIQEGESQEIKLYFDEGDDSSFGSGSRDGYLLPNQEDLKILNNNIGAMACQNLFGNVEGCPNSGSEENDWECVKDGEELMTNVWRGSECINTKTQEVVPVTSINKLSSIMDGSYKNEIYGIGWYAEGLGNPGAGDRINFISYKKAYNGYLDAEFLFPLEGLDANTPGIYNDVSDLNVSYKDITGIGIKLSGLDISTNEFCNSDSDCDQENDSICIFEPMEDEGICWSNTTKVPKTLNQFNAQTYAEIEINTCYDTDGGDNQNVAGKIMYFDNRSDEPFNPNDPYKNQELVPTYVEYSDYCSGNDVFEYYCQDNAGLGVGGIRKCNYGCANGRCLSKPINPIRNPDITIDD